MGLDCYLYRSTNAARVAELMGKNDPTDEENAELESLEERAPKTPDPRFPDHTCNLGYLRSSYNAGGYDRVAQERGWPTFAEIFEAGDDYLVRPDWNGALERVRAAIASARRKPETHTVMRFSPNHFMGKEQFVDSPKRALELFHETVAKHSENSDMRAFTNRDGTFFLDGISIEAVIFGLTNFLGTDRLETYLITRNEKQGDDDYYLQCLLIVEAICDQVIGTGKQADYYWHWSG